MIKLTIYLKAFLSLVPIMILSYLDLFLYAEVFKRGELKIIGFVYIFCFGIYVTHDKEKMEKRSLD